MVSFVWTVGLLDRALGVGGLDSLRHLPWLGRALGVGGVDPLRHLPLLGVDPRAASPSVRISHLPCVIFLCLHDSEFLCSSMAVTHSRVFFQLLWLCYSLMRLLFSCVAMLLPCLSAAVTLNAALRLCTPSCV